MHWRGLPRRWGKRHPLYSWQKDVIADIDAGNYYIFILKPPGIGATELALSYGIWKSLTDSNWTNGQVGILVGTSLGETEFMISRAKEIIAERDSEGRVKLDEKTNPIYKVPLHYSYNNKKEFTINTVRWMAHPAGHYDAVRAKPKMRMILGDEIAFFIKKKEDQTAIRSAFEHYKGKSDTLVWLITTAGEAPAGFAYDIFKEQNSMYSKHILGPEAGLEIDSQSGTSLLDPKAVEERRVKSPATYKREFELQWGYDKGNVFKPSDIDACVKEYDLEGWLTSSGCRQGIDPAFGTSEDGSQFAFVIAARNDNKVRIYDAEQGKALTFKQAEDLEREKIAHFGPEPICIDGAWPPFVKSVKSMINERIDYENDKDNENWWKVKPIMFNQYGREMLGNMAQLVSNHVLEVHPKFKELIEQMRFAQVKEDGKLDKTQHNLDLLDAARLALRGYHFNES